VSSRYIPVLWLIAIFAGLLASVDSRACSVPVFRYALDRWMPDAYRLEADAKSLAIGAIAADLRGDQDVRLNIQATPLVDNAAPGRATLRFPMESGESTDLWQGALTAGDYQAFTESPARKEIARRLLAGDSAVWVLVESGRAQPDQDSAKLLDEQIADVEKTAVLPVIQPDDPTSQIGPGPKMRVKFSVLRVARDAKDEQFFLAMLAGPGGLSALPADQPFAALVFGRGRVLGAWSPEKLTPQLIQQASRFLLAACSCEAKHLNPGWDLLMRVNWDAELARGDETVTVAAEKPAPVAALETVTYVPAEVNRSSTKSEKTWMTISLVAGAALFIGTVIAIRVRRRA